jgi:transposase
VSRCWTPKKYRPVVTQQFIREYTYAYTAVCPQTGETYSIIAPCNNTELMNFFLAELAIYYRHYRIIMVLDGAGWHTSKLLSVPENIRLLHLPPYSPELNPVEHIWDYLREQKKFNNYTFNSLDAVDDRLEITLGELHQEKDTIKSLCNFKWIPLIP